MFTLGQNEWPYVRARRLQRPTPLRATGLVKGLEEMALPANRSENPLRGFPLCWRYFRDIIPFLTRELN